MKRYFLIVAAVALATVSCSRIYDVNPSDPQEIGFRIWAENLTKARAQGSSTFASGDDFAVYGYKDKSDDSDANTVFDDVVVSTTDGTTWDYTPTAPARYWDVNYDKYIFYAISPAAVGTGGTVDPQTGEISASVTFSGSNNDILVADKKTVLKTDTPVNFGNGTAAYGAVNMVFNHVASLVDFKVKKASSLSSATVTVSAFTLSNVESAGVLTVSDAYTSTHPVVSWSSTATTTYTTTSGVTSVSTPVTVPEDGTFNPASPVATPAGSEFLINTLVVKPQDLDAQTLSITYQIAVTGGGTNEYTSVLNIKDFDNVDDADQNDTKFSAWKPGKHYTFYITLDARKIDFTAQITDWTAVSGFHYLIN